MDHNYGDLDILLKNVFLGLKSTLKEFLIPPDYDDLERFYRRESLCEHHAILKLLASNQGGGVRPEEIENQNMLFDYQKIQLLEKARNEGALDQNMNVALVMLKKNIKNLNLLSNSRAIGATIDGDKMPVFEDLRAFSNILARKNIDLNTVVGLSGNMYLV